MPKPWHVWAAAFVLIAAGLAAYHNSFSGPFVFDDIWSIPLNPSIRQFDTALTPPNVMGETVSGRPLLNASFAVNYAISGKQVWSYHAGNLLIHIAAGLALFGLVRRVLMLASVRERLGASEWTALSMAFVVAALWMLHPLQTESVTYIVQRAESLMALWYLLTLYCFVRAVSGPVQNKIWLILSVVSCFLGMASKEVMVSAPVIVLLLDRALVARSFREAITRRKVYYAGLACSWTSLAALAINTGSRGTTAGFGTPVSSWEYLLTQAGAIVHYLRLAVWPRGLVFDYGTDTVSSLAIVLPQALLIVALVGAAIWLLIRKPALGLIAFFFFAVLAPTSSFIPVATQTMAEHRMYLPLVAVVLAITLACWRLLGRGSVWALAACAVVLGVVTFNRNQDYRTVESIWRDTVEKKPNSARAHNNLANALADDGAPLDAIVHCQRAIELKPDFPQAYNNYGYSLAKLQRYDEALPYYDKALSYKQNALEIILCNRGFALYSLGRMDDAAQDFEAALTLRPEYPEALSNYGNVLCGQGRLDEALVKLDAALHIDPEYAAAWNNRGNVFSATGRDREEAMRCYKRAAQLDPKLWEAQDNVGRYCLALNRPAEAIPYFDASIALRPDYAPSYYGLGNAYLLTERAKESIPWFQRAVAIAPTYAGAHHNLAVALLNANRALESIAHFEASIKINPNQAPVYHNYAGALAQLGRLDEAILAEQSALRINPDFNWAREQLAKFISQRDHHNTAASN